MRTRNTMDRDKEAGDKKSSIIAPIVVGVVLALLVGGTAPWWWSVIFPQKRHEPPKLMNTSGELYRVVANAQCAASAWRSITTDGSIEIGLMGVSEDRNRVDLRVRQKVDGSMAESPESDITPGKWTDLPIPSRTLAIYVSKINDCWVQYDIKEMRK